MQQILAAFIFFTRLPLGRFASNITPENFKRVVSYWSMTGWLTSAITVLALYTSSLLLPYGLAILFAIISRLILTGCLHEDGLADFLDGFGGGISREKILSIMKDSHIGTYGVIGLIVYFGLYYSLLSTLPIELAGIAIIAGDPFCKGISAMTINRLPYAREEYESKSKMIYNKMNAKEYALNILCAIPPLFWLTKPIYFFATLLPVLVWFFLTYLMKKKIGGYTGDCCGATFLLCEISFYLGIVSIYSYLYS